MSKVKNKDDQIFNVIKERLNLKNNEDFFKCNLDHTHNNVVKIIKTGVGKTYNSAYFALYSLFNTNKKIVITTTKNENVEDLTFEMMKILNNEVSDKNRLEKFFNNKSPNKLNELGIRKLTSYAPISSKFIESTRIIITNHSYFFYNGDSTEYLQSTMLLKEQFINLNTVILIDEIDEFEKAAISIIDLNKFYKQCKVNNDFIEKVSNCFSAYDGKYYKENKDSLRYQLPREENLCYFDKIGDFETPKIIVSNLQGKDDISHLIHENFNVDVLNQLDDIGRREGFYISNHKEDNRNLLRVNIIRPVIISEEMIKDKHLIIDIIKNSLGCAIVTQVLDLTNKVREDDKIVQKEIQRFMTPQQFIDWAKRMNEEVYDQLIKRIIKEGDDLFKHKLVIRKKSILDDLDCKIYRFTATPSHLKELGYNLYYSTKKSPSSIKNIDIFFCKREKNIDQSILKASCEQFRNDEDINVLSFISRKETLNACFRKIKKLQNKSDYNNVCFITSVDDDTLDIRGHKAVISSGEEYGDRSENVSISYLNGSESTGKNYCETDLEIINIRHEINICSRLILTQDKVSFLDIEEASKRTVGQAGGRVERTFEKKQIYKALIMLGENESLVDDYIVSKEGNGIVYSKIKFETSNSTYDFEKSIEEAKRKLRSDNQCIEFKDKRKEKKYDENEIYIKYIEAQLKYLKENPKKKKLSFSQASKILGISDKTIKKAVIGNQET